MKNIRRISLISAASIAYITIFVFGISAQTKSIEKEVKKFHERLKASALTEIYANASDRLRETTNEKDFTKKLKSDLSKIGEIKSIENTGFPPPNPVSEQANSYKHESVVFLIKGTKGSYYEVLIWDLTGKVPKLSVYNTDYSARPMSGPAIEIK